MWWSGSRRHPDDHHSPGEALRARVSAAVSLLVEERGMTAQDVAESTGIDVRAVESRLSGLEPWDIDEMHSVACALGVDVVSLMRE